MKRWLWWTVIGVVLAVIFVGYGVTTSVENYKNYQHSLRLGEEYVNDGNYALAKIAFQDALKKRPNAQKAKTYFSQTQEYEKGLDQVEKRELTKARKNFQNVADTKGGLDILLKRASEKQAELKEVIAQHKLFEQLYERADSLSKNYEYTASNTELAAILGYKNIKMAYYDDIRTQAEKLKQYNNEELRALGYEVASSEKEVSSFETTKKEPVSKEQIKQARTELQTNGINVSQLNDDEIIKVILQAKEENKTLTQLAQEFK